MTPRERIRNAMDFKKVDAISWAESFYEETLIKFFSEGLPAHEITDLEWAMSRNGNLLLNWPKFMGFDPYSYFGCIDFWGCSVPVDIGPIPRFKQEKIREDAKYEEYIMETGARSRRFKKEMGKTTWYTMPQFLSLIHISEPTRPY